MVVGGTGFTGERVVRRLAEQGHRVTVVARRTSDTLLVRSVGARIATADLGDQTSLKTAFEGHDTLIFAASMGFGHVPQVVEAARAAGIRRAVFVSTTAVLTRLPVRSKPIRLAAEAAVRNSGLPWTLLRPTMIYGSARDRNMCRLLRHLKRWRVVPLAGRGAALQQPVHVEDVAHAIVASAASASAAGREYVVSGATALTLRELVHHAAAAVGVSPILIPMPDRACSGMLRFAERSGIGLPLRAEQLERLNEDKAFDHAAAKADLGVEPRCFESGIRAEAIELGLADR